MSVSRGKRLAAAAYYGVVSIVVQFATKLVLSTVVMYLVARPRLELRIAKSVLPLSIVNLFSISAGFMGTQGLNIPMFVALRRFTILFTVIVEFLMFSRKQSAPTLSAVGIMISGALIASVTDLTFNARGYAAVLVNDLLQAAYLVIVKYVKDVDNLGSIKNLLATLLGAVAFGDYIFNTANATGLACKISLGKIFVDFLHLVDDIVWDSSLC
eukprot:jgi/Pico_ML_1/51646/g224.t1